MILLGVSRGLVWLLIGLAFSVWAGWAGAAKVAPEVRGAVFSGGFINGLLVGPVAVPLAYWF